MVGGEPLAAFHHWPVPRLEKLEAQGAWESGEGGPRQDQQDHPQLEQEFGDEPQHEEDGVRQLASAFEGVQIVGEPVEHPAAGVVVEEGDPRREQATKAVVMDSPGMGQSQSEPGLD